MKEGSPSSTSLLIARALLLADATPALRPMLIGDSAELTRKLLASAPAAPWFDFAMKHLSLRRALLGVERLCLPGVLLHWLARKRLIDAHAHEAVAAGCHQVIVLGAGLDTLSLRLAPEALSFELDHPSPQIIKRRAFPEGPELIAADILHTPVMDLLRGQPRFAASQPSLFVAEGLLTYLPPERVAALFRELAAVSAPGSRFVFSIMETRPGKPIGFHNEPRVIGQWLRWRQEVMHWALAVGAAEGFAAQHGWNVISLSTPEELRRRFLATAHLEHAALAAGETVALAYLRAP